MKRIPKRAREYIFWGVFLIAFPSIASFYHGHTGKMLVTTAVTRGTAFEEAVLYVNYHDFWGAQAVIMNKPMSPDDAAKLPGPPPELKWNVDVYFGGPVQTGTYNFLLLEDETKEHGFVLAPVKELRETRPDLVQDLDAHKNKKPLKLFMGYAGWTVLQLNKEMLVGAWGVADYDAEILFKSAPADAWPKAMEKVLKDRPAASGGA